jgi:hypothetical protein
MTDREKKKLAKVLATADGGCSNCVSDIAYEMDKAFPGEGWSERVMLAFDPDYFKPRPPVKPSKMDLKQFNKILKDAWNKDAWDKILYKQNPMSGPPK